MRKTCQELHVAVMRSVALGLDLDESFFDEKIDQQHHNLRLLSYPPIRTELLSGEGQARANAHSGAFTSCFWFVLTDRVWRLRNYNLAIPGFRQ